MSQNIISVFGSSRCAERSDLYRLARQLGEALARAGFAVASGGYGGVMGAVSQGAAESGGHVIGVVTNSISAKANPWVRQKIVVENWEQRLHKLIALGDGFIACRGGTGTLVELAVAWEMMNKNVMPRRPLVVLGDFWRPVTDLIASGEDGAGAGNLVCFADSVPAALDVLRAHLTAGR